MNTSTLLTPVSASERIAAMDVVRGFALFGILLMNIEGLVGPLFGSITGLDPALRGADRWADALIYILVQGKFYTLFSLLFGMGFAVMMARAQKAGRPFVGVYLRRTFALLAIGLLHVLLVWSGDILTIYALLAFAMLLLFRNTPTSGLPTWSVVLYLLPSGFVVLMGLLGSLAQFDPAAAAEMNKAMLEQEQAMTDALAAQRAAYGSGTYADAIARRWQDFLLFLGYLPVMGLQILGMFVLGAWFVRSGAIARPQDFVPLYARLRWIALPLGLALMLASFALAPTVDFGRLDIASSTATALGAIGSVLMCLGYLGWLLKGLQLAWWAPKLRLLAPAGRMALTNYLTQSIVCTLLFYGYGLGYFEQLPRAWQVPFVFGLFALQVLISHWWLARFRFGPAEWVWRALTYGRRPAMRLAEARAG